MWQFFGWKIQASSTTKYFNFFFFLVAIVQKFTTWKKYELIWKKIKKLNGWANLFLEIMCQNMEKRSIAKENSIFIANFHLLFQLGLKLVNQYAYFNSLGKSHILGPQLHYWSLLLWVFFPHCRATCIFCVDIGTDNLLCLKAIHEAASVGLHVVVHCLHS